MVFHLDDGSYRIQRCDQCEVFDSDDSAIVHVIRICARRIAMDHTSIGEATKVETIRKNHLEWALESLAADIEKGRVEFRYEDARNV